MLTTDAISKLELVHERIPIVRLCFGLTICLREPPTLIASDLIYAYDKFVTLVGKATLRHYATQTMRKHRPVTPRALSIFGSWLAPNAPTSESYGIELTNADPFNGAPTIKFDFTGQEVTNAGRLKSATQVRYVFPPDWGAERSAEVLDIAIELCGRLPFQSGYVCYGFECSRYFPRPAHEHAWAHSMRHPGIHIHQDVKDAAAAGFDAVRTVGWLTLLNEAFVTELGQPPVFDKCRVQAVKGGILIQAGDVPEIGDVNRKQDLPSYREAFRYIAPLVHRANARSAWVSLADDAGPRTERWLNRFADG